MFKIKLTPTAIHSFHRLHPEIKKQLKDALSTLKDNPYSGKQLREELNFFRSFKIKRYRVIYQVDDIYEIATKLLQQDV